MKDNKKRKRSVSEKVIMQERRLMIWSLRKYIGQTAISAAIRCAQQKTRRGADKIKKEN